MDYYSSLDARFLDAETPTLFEIISSQQLDNLLTPSIRYILAYYTQRSPRYLIRVLNRFDELNLLGRGFIEYQTLKNWNSSFIEKFYGMKRSNNDLKFLKNPQIPLEIRESRKRLTKLQVAISLIDIVGVPYIKEKLELFYDKLYSKYLLNGESMTFFERSFIKMYPILKMCLQISNLICLITMLGGHNKSPSILTWLGKMRYSRLTQYDYDLNDLDKIAKKIDPGSSGHSIKAQVRPPSLTQILSTFSRTAYGRSRYMFYLLSNKIFPLSIFLLKFLEWWNSSEFVSKLKHKQEIEIDAPAVAKGQYVSTESCPLCKQSITTPAVLDTGYVFCYKCIHSYITSQTTEPARCPVSGEALLNCKMIGGQDSNNASEITWQIDGLRRLMI